MQGDREENKSDQIQRDESDSKILRHIKTNLPSRNKSKQLQDYSADASINSQSAAMIEKSRDYGADSARDNNNNSHIKERSASLASGFEVCGGNSFDSTHLAVIHRKQQSESPVRQTQILARFAKDLPQELQLPQDGRSLVHHLRTSSQTKINLRQKSADFQVFDDVVNYRKLVLFIKHWKSQSDFDLLQLKDLVVCYGAQLCDENTSQVVLETCLKLSQLLLHFIDTHYSQLLAQGFQACKKILVEFENIKSEYYAQAAGLSRQEVSVLNYLISEVRYVFSRFGRTITIYEVIAAKYRLTQRGDDFIQPAKPSTLERKVSKRTISPTDITKDTSLPLVLLSSEEKTEVVIKQQFQVQRSVWREQYDNEKAMSVPTIVCRVCGLNFYADQSKKHSTFCIQKAEKLKEQRKLDQQFLQMSSQSTETMLLIQQENSKNQNLANLLQTPTLQRRSFMAPKQGQFELNPTQQQNSSAKAVNVLAQYAVGPLPQRGTDANKLDQKTTTTAKDQSLAGLKNFQNVLNMRDGNGNPLMTPQPHKAGNAGKGITQLNQPQGANNYFNALTQIRRDVVLPTVVEEKNPAKAVSNYPSLTPTTNVGTAQTKTPKALIKDNLDSILTKKLPQSPYLETFKSKYAQSLFTQGSTTIAPSDPSTSSIKQGKRRAFWQKVQAQLYKSAQKHDKDNITLIKQKFEILNKSGGHMSLLDKRLNSLVVSRQPKAKKEDPVIKIDSSKYASAFQDKNALMSVCASPLITSSGRFARQQQPQQVLIDSRTGVRTQMENKQSSNTTISSLKGSQIVCQTPMISSTNNRLQGKQDMESLEVLKALSNDAFNISINAEPISFQQQTEVFKVQSQKIAQLLTATSLNQKTIDLLNKYKDLIASKIESLHELLQIERGYLVTMPGIIQKQRQKEDQMNELKVKKMIDQINPLATEKKVKTAKRKESVKNISSSQKIPNNRSQAVNSKPVKQYSKLALKPPSSKQIKEESEKELRKLAEISDLSDDDHLCPVETLTKVQPSFKLSFLFQKQLQEMLPRPNKQTALSYVHLPLFKETGSDYDDDKPVTFAFPPVVKRKLDKRRVQTFKLDREQSDIDSFSSDSFKSCHSQPESPCEIIKFRVRSKSDIVIGGNVFGDKEEISTWENQSEFLDMVYVSALTNQKSKSNLRLKSTKKRSESLSSVQLDQEDSSSSSSSDGVGLLQMEQVRFNSCSILPSHLESCRLDRQQITKQNVQITDFNLLKTLSWGAYGRVVLSRKKDTKDLFAIKVMDKAAMVHLNVAEFVMNERNILNQIDCDYIVRGMYTFQTPKYLYMVMEYMRGGDFGNLLEKCGCFNLETARFYLAHIVAGLEHLHSRGIVHRDLKPENMLIGADGHIKLTDFGLSDAGLKKVLEDVPSKEESKDSPEKGSQKKYRIVGTADYMAPEVILGHDVSTLMDFWSLGIIAYEFMTGDLPFNCESQDQIFKNVLYKPIELPPEGIEEGQMHPDARDFLSKLLQRDPKKRLGAKNGIKDIKDHPFFEGINWKQLMREPAPWVPPAAKDLDMTNFPKAQQQEGDPGLQKLIEEEGLNTEQSLPSTPKLNVREFNQFNGVSYSALQNINEAESQKALRWMQRQKKKIAENGQDPKRELARFQDKDSITKTVNQTKAHLRSISAERKKIIRPF